MAPSVGRRGRGRRCWRHDAVQFKRTILELRNRLAVHTPYTANDLGHFAELCVVGGLDLGAALRILREAGSLREAEQHVQQEIIAPPPPPVAILRVTIDGLEIKGDVEEALASLRASFETTFGATFGGGRCSTTRGPLHRLGVHWSCR